MMLGLFDPATDKSMETFSVTIGGLLAAIWYMKQLFGKKEKSKIQVMPDPLTFQEAAQYVHKSEFEKQVSENKDDHDKILAKIGGVERGATASIEAKVEVVRKDVAGVGLKVAGLEATTNLQNQSLAAIQSDVKRLLERRST